MKTLNSYITERLHITKKTSVQKYNYFPKTRKELRKILKERLAEDKNADLNDIDVSKITNMATDELLTGLFEKLDPHNIDISKWDVSNVTDMSYMFYDCKNFNSDLSNWDVSNVRSMKVMFRGCGNFNSDLSKWDVNNVENMINMFKNCSKFEGKGLENWDVSNVIYMKDMFHNSPLENHLPKWYKE